MGARGIPSCPLFFDNLFVAENNRLGPEGKQGFKVVMEALNQSRPIVAARGFARRCRRQRARACTRRGDGEMF